MPGRSKLLVAVAVAAIAVAACGFQLTGPFEGFDGQGTRVSGQFADLAAAQSARSGAVAAAVRANDVEGLRVYVRERPELSTTVGANGRFTLSGLPAGSWTLLFESAGQVIGELRFTSVRSNQEIRITVSLIAGEVVLVEEDRDEVSFDEDCPRGPGFWCQN